ncbi:MAG TPA: prephenate dehydrogenase/arogenate dehydrogenase family protein, partial [Gammaproteobacteria bacterium]|nr:prephenate dehydrogenase/arogenate dehydrogenase family protein [Gammaproteobacteria bacterium]
MNIGIIGFGDFSKTIIRYLSPHATIVVATRQKNPKTNLKCRFVDDQEALSQEIVILSIPAQFLESYISQHVDNVRPGTLVVDVCSVKVKPVEILNRLLPKEIQILATHPMFGPFSAADSL